jgi:uncharacterized protein
MIVAVTGATGFVGRRLLETLASEGCEVRGLSRRPRPAAFEGTGAVIHLAGEPVAQRWSHEAKRRIRDSRVLGTEHLIQALSATSKRPRVLVSASAVGYYGSRGDVVLTEDSGPGKGFLPEVCQEWEKSADLAGTLGMRVVKLRIGVVLGRGGGALEQMLPPFRMGAGGPLAGGRQWMSWIHLDDLISLIRFAVDNPSASGAFNATAPNPLRNAEFTKELGRTLKRPAFLPVPKFALELLYGEMSEVVLASQRAVPQAAQRAGFVFRYPDAGAALREILG